MMKLIYYWWFTKYFVYYTILQRYLTQMANKKSTANKAFKMTNNNVIKACHVGKFITSYGGRVIVASGSGSRVPPLNQRVGTYEIQFLKPCVAQVVHSCASGLNWFTQRRQPVGSGGVTDN